MFRPPKSALKIYKNKPSTIKIFFNQFLRSCLIDIHIDGFVNRCQFHLQLSSTVFFLYESAFWSFSLIAIWPCNFLAQEYLQKSCLKYKMLVKLTLADWRSKWTRRPSPGATSTLTMLSTLILNGGKKKTLLYFIFRPLKAKKNLRTPKVFIGTPGGTLNSSKIIFNIYSALLL